MEELCKACGAHERKKVRGDREKRELMNRLKRIEGQVRGLERMLEEDAYCPDILVQASAVNSALNSFSRTLLANHLHSCVTEDIRAGRDEAVDELMETLKKMMK
jgi:DNA-binding FrmR family transcriptional regulator